MARERYRTVVCRSCGLEVDESAPRRGFTFERLPCPNCGSNAREYRLGLSGLVTPRGDVTIQAQAATATGMALEPSVSVEQGIAAGTFTRMVVWSKTPDAWLAEVRDESGNLVALEINFDALDTLVLLAEHLLPPGE